MLPSSLTFPPHTSANSVVFVVFLLMDRPQAWLNNYLTISGKEATCIMLTLITSECYMLKFKTGLLFIFFGGFCTRRSLQQQQQQHSCITQTWVRSEGGGGDLVIIAVSGGMFWNLEQSVAVSQILLSVQFNAVHSSCSTANILTVCCLTAASFFLACD